MRRANGILAMAILVLFLIHMVAGAFQMAGVFPGGNRVLNILAYITVALIAAHAAIGIKLTCDTIRAIKKSGVSYLRENKKFWACRLSAGVVLITVCFHTVEFLGTNDGAYRLNFFGGPQLFVNILMVAGIAVHVITAIRPSLITFGIKSLAKYALDILIVLSVILLFAAAAFIIYYIRWAAL